MRASARQNSPPYRGSARDDLFVEYEGTPYLTGLAHLCSALGVFIGAWTVIVLLGEIHRGLAKCWTLILILVIIVAVNATVQLIRHRRRRALGLTRAQRRWRIGVGPPPADKPSRERRSSREASR